MQAIGVSLKARELPCALLFNVRLLINIIVVVAGG
jgi:hypothetical protein